MASSKISGLPTGAPATGPDEFIVARGGFNYKLTAAELATFIGASTFATTDLSDTDPTAPTITGQILVFNSVSGNYEPNTILDGGSF